MARATLTYVYRERLVWLEGLVADRHPIGLSERHPMSHGICDAHADALRVPNGWSLEDRRTPRAAPSTSAIAS